MPADPRWERLGELFEAALAMPRAEREAWLSQACRDDLELRAEVEQMLAAQEGAGGILDKPVHRLASVALAEAEQAQMHRWQVGPYRLIREIGRGGMGVVWQAYDPRLDRFVALKFLLGGDEQAKTRLFTEAKAASALDHPNICTVHDIGETGDGQLYIAMAYYSGQTLAQKIAQGPLPVEEAIAVAVQVAEALHHAHGAGIIHRDIKPSNIMITARGEVKVLDFGVAKRETAGGETGAIFGTVGYMSPEQARGDKVDHRTDLWSLGVVLCEMVTGRTPDGEGSLRDSGSDLPPAFDAFLHKALAESLELRYVRAAEFLADLNALRRPAPPRFPAHTLPAALTSFVGREREVEQVSALLACARIVTLTGPAGAGKTRLSLRVAEEVAHDFPDGAVFVALASIRDAGLVTSEIARAAGLVGPAAHAGLDSLNNALKDRRLLLVLDNFEQVVAAAQVVGELLAACPSVKALVTSRVGLRLSGEHEFPLPPLQLPDLKDTTGADALRQFSSVALFVERARAVRPDFALTDANARAVAELCVRLDGLPLAIELAAARSKLFSPQAMLARLGKRLDLLRGGPRDYPNRHQTLRQAMAWSYDLLDNQVARFFRRLAVFAGGCTLEAAEALCRATADLTLDAVDGIACLVDQSLLQPQESKDGEPRFVMLETVRDYALERLQETGEKDAMRRAHAAWFLKFAERAEPELTGAEQGAWLDRLEVEHENLRAALAWAEERGEVSIALRIGVAIWRFWLVRGYLHEGRRRLERLLALPVHETEAAVRARALNGLGTLTHSGGDNARARALLEGSLVLCRQTGDKRCIAAVLNNLGWVACELSDFGPACALSREGLALNRELGEKRGIAIALNNLGWVANYQGDYRAAIAFHQESLDLRREIGDRRGVAFALTNLAWAEQIHGDYGQAERLIEEAAAILRAMNDKSILGWTLMLRGWIARDQGQHERAIPVLEESEAIWRESGNLSGLAATLSVLGIVLSEQQEPDRAAPLLDEALRAWKAVGGAWGVALALYGQGKVAQSKRNSERAAALYEESLAARQAVGDNRGIAECLEAIAEIAIAQSNLEKSARLLAAASSLRQQINSPVPPCRRPAYEAQIAALRAGLGEEEFVRVWPEGKELTQGQAEKTSLMSNKLASTRTGESVATS